MVGIDRSISQMDPTPSLSNPSVSKPTLPQQGEPMSIWMLPRKPTLITSLFIKEENEETEEKKCTYCYEIPVVGFDGETIGTIEVHLYNTHKTTFNKQDASLYFADVYRLLKIHHIDGIWYSAVLAQAYTEGGAGKTGVYSHTNNLFGMKASSTWGGYVYSRSTQTVYKNYEIAKKYGAKDLFRAYGTINESIKDYLRLVQREPYQKVLASKSPQSYLKTLLNNGYGTTSMLDVWMSVIDIFDLTTYDRGK
jgi:hypothetical protein